jgi:hypothetical protein
VVFFRRDERRVRSLGVVKTQLGLGLGGTRQGERPAELLLCLGHARRRARESRAARQKRRQAARILGGRVDLRVHGTRGRLPRTLGLASGRAHHVVVGEGAVGSRLDADELAPSRLDIALGAREISRPSARLAAGEGAKRTLRTLGALFGVRDERRPTIELGAQRFSLRDDRAQLGSERALAYDHLEPIEPSALAAYRQDLRATCRDPERVGAPRFEPTEARLELVELLEAPLYRFEHLARGRRQEALEEGAGLSRADDELAVGLRDRPEPAGALVGGLATEEELRHASPILSDASQHRARAQRGRQLLARPWPRALRAADRQRDVFERTSTNEPPARHRRLQGRGREPHSDHLSLRRARELERHVRDRGAFADGTGGPMPEHDARERSTFVPASAHPRRRVQLDVAARERGVDGIEHRGLARAVVAQEKEVSAGRRTTAPDLDGLVHEVVEADQSNARQGQGGAPPVLLRKKGLHTTSNAYRIAS